MSWAVFNHVYNKCFQETWNDFLYSWYLSNQLLYWVSLWGISLFEKKLKGLLHTNLLNLSVHNPSCQGRIYFAKLLQKVNNVIILICIAQTTIIPLVAFIFICARETITFWPQTQIIACLHNPVSTSLLSKVPRLLTDFRNGQPYPQESHQDLNHNLTNLHSWDSKR